MKIINVTVIIALLFSGYALTQDIYGSRQVEPIGQTPENSSIEEQIEIDSLENNPYFRVLDEIVVETQRPVIQSDGAKLTYNAEEDKSSQSGNVLELLRKIPMVTVDGDNNIKINGNGNFKILVNGKENPMLSQNASTILKNMPATTIKKVEVITDPGAKYDAEGLGGILNLITETKQNADGYSGSLSAGVSRQQGIFGSAYGIGKIKNVTINANLTYSNGYPMPQGNESRAEVTYHSSTESGKLISESSQKTPFQFWNGGINMSWEPNSSNLFTLSANFTDVAAKIKDLFTTDSRYNTSDQLIWRTRNEMGGNLSNLSLNTSASFQHNFSSEKHYLSLSYLYNFGKTRMDLESHYKDMENIDFEKIWQTNFTNNLSRENTVQLDYVNGFKGDRHLLESGAKAIFRHNTAFSYTSAGKTQESQENIPSNTSDIAQIQNVYAIYSSYNGTYGNLSTRIGLRYEHTLMGIDYHYGNNSDFRKQLDDLVPNASLSWNFDPVSLIRLAYQMRISRPNLNQVNPYKQDALGMFQQTGNPDLKSEQSHNVSLTFSKFWRVVGGNISIRYNHIDNMIADYTYLDNNIVTSSYANMGLHQTFSINGFFNWQIIHGMSANLSGAVRYDHFKAPTMDMKNHGWSGNLNASWNYKLNNDYNFSAYGGLSSNTITLEGYWGGWHYYGVSAGKDLLKDKSLNITLNAMNMFEDRRTWSALTTNKEVTNRQISKMKSWDIGVTLTWKFGKLNMQVKETDSKIINDDKSDSGGNGIGPSTVGGK